MVEVRAHVRGTVVEVRARPGEDLRAGDVALVVESMKMEYPVAVRHPGRVREVRVAPGDLVAEGQVVAVLEPMDADATPAAPGRDDRRAEAGRTPTAGIRPDLAEVLERHRLLLDEARPAAVARRRERGRRTARENVADLLDPGSFVEYGGLALAAQRSRRSLEELIERTPADGLVTGVGTVGGIRCAVLAYDATVLAGTQGQVNHRKKDRLFELAAHEGLPVVLFAEGGGGRPGDTDVPTVSGLDVRAFHLFARLSARVPLIGIAAGYCFAGNAALLGCCDVVIATEDANIGMGGPAMVEGGGLGTHRAEDIGPVSVQSANGVVDVVVPDEAAAVDVARRYLSLVREPVATPGTGPDPAALRDVVPAQRRRAYDVRAVVELLLDDGSALELRSGFAPGMVTALGRVGGRSLAVVANDPMHLAGAIDADGADKAARFLQLCDAHRIPVLFLCDTPGFMVGPEAEERATVRHVSRLMVTGANLSVPFGTIVLRRAYGLGAMAMAGGSFAAPRFCVAWPSGELGGMGLEGAVRLGFRDELAAVEDPDERERLFQRLVAAAHDNGRALNTATILELDDVIDPADSRRWIARLFEDRPGDGPTVTARRPFIDTW
jgi:acetyl-CoA carboxylase carboxyltransferase component